MIPLRDLNPTHGTPVVNRLLLLSILATWIYTLTLVRTPGALDAFYSAYAFDWDTFTAALGAGRFTIATFAPLITHMFLHGGWLHVLGNMLYLWIFGDNVEDRLGSLRYLFFYLAGGIIAAIGQGLIEPSPMVGASGAIASVLGAYLVLFPGARVSTLVFLGIFISVVRLPAIIVIGFFIVIQLLDGIAQLRVSGAPSAEQVAYFAHLVGFVAGIVLVLLMRPRRFVSGRR
ncbi:MAG: rhomboid family intramembrane serine protease [Candidatus Limnocylindria bacterium]|nr:rhomboid family intramembrane serine protease [Candidatus Limnocylindria bacterium]